MAAVPSPAARPAQVVLAVKDLRHAKSRLVGAVPAEHHTALVLAMLSDTVEAALASPQVAAAHVITRDADVAATARRCGASVIADPRHEGLNQALQHASALVEQRPLCALQPDLPALRAQELTAALAAAPSHGPRCFLTDRHGTGTTVLVSLDGALRPAFGPDSASRHSASGAYRLVGSWPGLGCDVDNLADLAAALRLGIGPATARVLDGWATVATVQEHRDGVVVMRTDDGHVLHSSDAAAQLGGWRQLRPGQRVRAYPDRDATVRLVTLPSGTLPG